MSELSKDIHELPAETEIEKALKEYLAQIDIDTRLPSVVKDLAISSLSVIGAVVKSDVLLVILALRLNETIDYLEQVEAILANPNDPS